MSWREEYQAGSFRGVGFKAQAHERRGGRRVATHEFPGRDEPLNEDMGRLSRQFTFECFVSGADYRRQRDALIDALEAYGPGLFVHPWHGEMQLSVFNYRTSESTDEGGICFFSIDFGEAGLPVADTGRIDTRRAASDIADEIIAEAPSALAEDFDVTGVAAFVEEAAADLVAVSAELVKFSAGANGGIGPALRAFDASLQFLPSSISSLLRSPVALGRAVTGLIQTVSALGGTPRQKQISFAAIADIDLETRPVIGGTPSRLRQSANQDALVHIVSVSAAAELVRAASAIKFTSYEDALDTRDRIAAQLDRLALLSADAGRDSRAARFDALRRAIVRDINARGGTLSRTHDLAIARTQPALVIANRLYGAIDPAARAADLAARNMVAHPGFVLGGRTLRVLTAEQSGTGVQRA